MNGLHPSFWATLVGWFLAQSIKMISCFIRSGKLDFSYLVSTGGMPSAHSAMVSGLATSVGITVGFGKPIFAVSFAFAVDVVFVLGCSS